MSRGRSGTIGVLVIVVSGVTMAGAVSSPWYRTTTASTIGGVEVTDTVVTRGVELAPLVLPIGLAVAAGAVLVAFLRGRARQAASAIVVVAALAALVDVVRALVGSSAGGAMTAAPGVAVIAAFAVAAGGALTWRRPSGATLPARFDIDAVDPDDEWNAATHPDERDL